MNQEVRNASFDFHDLEAMMTLGHLTIYSTEETGRVYAVADLYRRAMGKSSVEKIHPVGTSGYWVDSDKDDPEYNEGDRYREIYQRDGSFSSMGIKFGSKVLIDTSDKRKTGLVCVQIGDYPLLAFAKESADAVLFTFPNPFYSCFTCSKQNLDQTVKFLGVPVLYNEG